MLSILQYLTIIALLFYSLQGLYAKCPRSDKAKISNGIVAAVRKLGGRFIELDEKSGSYYGIGAKKACAKTSQALREGQTKIRQKIYGDMRGRERSPSRAVPVEGYAGYSVQLLQSLYSSDQSMLSSEHVPSYQTVSPSPSLVYKDSGNVNQVQKHYLHLEEPLKHDMHCNHVYDGSLDFEKGARRVTADEFDRVKKRCLYLEEPSKQDSEYNHGVSGDHLDFAKSVCNVTAV